MKKKIALATLAMLPLTAASASAGSDSQIGVVTADSLNIRSGASTKYSVISTAKKNEKVTILDSSNGWYKVKLSSGKEGWASSAYITKISNDDQNSSTWKKKVSVSSLNMRSGASTSYRVITTLKKDQVVEVMSESNGWSKIKYDGRIGYVYSEYLETVNEVSNNVTKNKEVNTASLNVRSGPSTSYSIVGSVKKGQVVEIISESNGWSKINYNGKQAYVSSAYLSPVSNSVKPENKPESKPENNPESKPESKPENKPENSNMNKEVNTASLNVRSGPGTSYSIVGSVKKGQVVEIISESNGWSKIHYNGKQAYVSSAYLSPISNTAKPENKPESNPENNPENKPENKPENSNMNKEVNTASLNVRSGPGTSYSIVGSVKKGQVVEIISESNGWSKINYNGKQAYVSSAYLSPISNSVTPETPDVPSSKPDDSNQNANGATIINKALNYTLSDHVNKQLERVSVGGNVIDPSKPRAFIGAEAEDIEYFLNPDNFKNSSKGMMQFLRIDSYKGGVTVEELNSYLNSLSPASSGTNVFYNQGAAFINAAQKYNIDLVYLVSHAMWETGYGKSILAQGQTITSYKGQPLPQPVKVYNFFGIGAIDKSANVSGAEAAYSNGWTSIEATIDGSAQWIASNYIKSSKYNQNTIYKMKWNYDYSWHQYATDVNWANGISGIMNNVIKLYDTPSNLVFEVPKYK